MKNCKEIKWMYHPVKGLYAVCTCCGKEVKGNDKKVSTNNNC